MYRVIFAATLVGIVSLGLGAASRSVADDGGRKGVQATIAPDTAVIVFDLPTGATVEVNGQDYQQERRLVVRPLAPGETYIYDAVIRFGTDAETRKRILVRGGWNVLVREPQFQQKDSEQILPVEPTDSVYSIALSPNGQLAAAGLLDQAAIVWDIKTGQVLRKYQASDLRGGSTPSISFSPDGSALLAGSAGNTAVVWDVATGKERFRLAEYSGYSGGVAYSPDGAVIATTGENGVLLLWNAATGEQVARFEDNGGSLYALAFAPDGRKLAVGVHLGDKGGQIIVWDIPSRLPIRQIAVPASIESLCYDSKGERIIAGGGQYDKPGWAGVWNAVTGEPMATLRGLEHRVQRVRFDSVNQQIVTAGGSNKKGQVNGELKFWNAESGALLTTLGPFSEEIEDACFTNDSKAIWIASDEKDSRAACWDIASKQPIARLASSWRGFEVFDVSNDNRFLLGQLRHADKGVVANSLVLLDLKTGREIRRLVYQPERACWNARFGIDAETVIALYANSQAIVWKTANGSVISSQSLPVESIWSSEISARGDRVLAQYSTGEGINNDFVAVFEISSGRRLQTFGPWYALHGKSLSADGRRVAVDMRKRNDKSFSYATYLWDVDSGRELQRWESESSGEFGVALDADGSRIARKGYFRQMELRDVGSGNVLWSTEPGQGKSDLRWARDGKFLTYNNYDGDQTIVNAATGERLRGLESLAFNHVPIFLSDHRYLFANLRGHAVLADVATDEQLLEFYSTTHGLVVRSPAGLLDCTPADSASIRRRVGDGLETVEIGDWATALQTKELLPRVLRGERPSPPAPPTMEKTPRLRFLSQADAATVPSEKVVVEVEASDAEGGINGPWLWHDATRIERGEDIPGPAGSRRRRFNLSLHPGANRVEADATSADGRHSSSPALTTLTLTLTKEDSVEESAAAAPPEIVLQTGHPDSIIAAAISPNGKLLATASRDRTTLLWNMATGRQLRSIAGPNGYYFEAVLAFSSDGRWLLIGNDRAVHVRDVETGRLVRVLSYGAKSIAFSSSGRELLLTKNYPGASLWSTETWSMIRAYPFDCNGAALSPDGKQIALAVDRASDDKPAKYFGRVLLLHANSGEVIREFEEHRQSINGLAFHPGGKFLVDASSDFNEQHGIANVYDVQSGKIVDKYSALKGKLTSVSFSHDGTHVLLAGNDKTPVVVDFKTGQVARHFHHGHDEYATVGLFAPGGHLALTASSDRTAMLWDVESGSLVRKFRGYVDKATRLSVSRDGQKIAVAAGRGSAVLWNAAGYAETTFAVDDYPDIVLDADSKLLYSKTRDSEKAVEVLDATTGEQRWTLPRRDEAPTPDRILVSPDRGWLMTTGYRYVDDAPVMFADFWDLNNRTLRRTIQSDISPTADYVCLSPSGQLLFVYGSRKRGDEYVSFVELWDTSTFQKRRTIETYTTGAAISPDDRQLYVASQSSIVVWDVGTGSKMRTMSLVADGRHMAMRPDGEQVAVGSEKGLIMLVDTRRGEIVHLLRGHTAEVNGLAYLGDGQRLASVSNDGSCRIWDVQSGRELGRFYSVDNGKDWLAVTPDGYFAGSEGGRRVVSWKVGNEYYPLELYEKEFQKPEIVARRFRGDAIEPAAVGAKPTPGNVPPKISLKVEKTDEQTLTVLVTASASSGSSIATIRITVDGREISSDRTRAIVRTQVGSTAEFSASAEFPPGKNAASIAAVVQDSNGLDSETATVNVMRPTKASETKGTLYVVAVGVSEYQYREYNLGYSHADAKAVAEMFEKQSGKAFVDVKTRVLANADATAPNVRAALEWLESSCKSTDVAVVLFSGHGIRGNLGRLYYFTHEGDLDTLKTTCLDWADVPRILKGVQAKQILFLADCCHAGAFGERSASQDELSYSLMKNAGVMVFASSRGNEKSLEHPSWGHGAFTYALLEGLRDGKADLIADGKITVSEWQTYVSNRVKALTGDRQHPHIPRLENFDPELIIGEVK